MLHCAHLTAPEADTQLFLLNVHEMSKVACQQLADPALCLQTTYALDAAGKVANGSTSALTLNCLLTKHDALAP
jgi:hypothetical protein